MIQLPSTLPPEGTEAAVEAHEWQRAQASLELARALRSPVRICEALSAMGRCERRAGWIVDASDTFDEALRWAQLLPYPDLMVDLLCERGELAVAAAHDNDLPGTEPDADALLLARACAAEAVRLVARVSDPAWEVKVLLRASDLYNRLGNDVEAVALQARALERMGQPRLEEIHPPRAIEAAAHPTLQ